MDKKQAYRLICNKHFNKCIYAFIVILIILSYRMLGTFEFINLDDPVFVENTIVKKGLNKDSIHWSLFLSGENRAWIPLTWLSHIVDSQLFGMDSGKYHLMNVMFHLVNSILLFIVFRRMTGAKWESAFMAIIFAIHPINVETVSWIAARKDLLYTLFCLLVFLTYHKYGKEDQIFYYLLSIIFFVLSLMAKPFMLGLPCILIVLDYWPLKRFNNRYLSLKKKTVPNNHELAENNKEIFWLILEKVPFFIVSGLFVYLSIQNKTGIVHEEMKPILTNLSYSVVSGAQFIGKLFYPVNLSVIYSGSDMYDTWAIVCICMGFALVSIGVVWQMKNRPYLLTGWFWFVATLIPIWGLIFAGWPTTLNDRYAYMSFIGLYLMVSWGCSGIIRKYFLSRKIVFMLGLLCVLLTMGLTNRQVRYWQSSIDLFTHTIRNYPDADIAYINLGSALASQGETEKAIFYLQLGIRNNSNKLLLPLYYNNLGSIYLNNGDIDNAVYYLKKSINFKSSYSEAHNNLGLAMLYSGNIAEAIGYFKAALHSNSKNIKALDNYRHAIKDYNEIKKAIDHLETAINDFEDCPESKSNQSIEAVRKRFFELEEAGKNYFRRLQISAKVQEFSGHSLSMTDHVYRKYHQFLESHSGSCHR